MRIAFCCSEVVPFVKTGGLGDVCGALPLALEALDQQVEVFLPYYGVIDPTAHPIREIDGTWSTATIGKGVIVHFIRQEKYFGRDGIYGDATGDYPDNLERFQYFCRRVIEILKQRQQQMDIIHCHDWQTALIPVYLRHRYQEDPFFKDTKTVLSVHNLAFQGVFARDRFPVLELSDSLYTEEGFAFYNQLNLLKAGLLFSDAVATVSPTYAQEIQTPEFGCGLEGVIRLRCNNLIGILNGVDTQIWDPKTDQHIKYRFGPRDFNGKHKNKHHLQKLCRLPARKEFPVFGFVGRLSHQKGVDLILQSLMELMALDIQIVILGVGDENYQYRLEEAALHYPDKISVHCQFNEPLAHQIYAGSDFLLMPSVFEPCGLSQMIALRYGTIPLVHRVGGLADTVTPYQDGGNGLVFAQFNQEAFCAAVRDAVKLFGDRPVLENLFHQTFSYDCSWKESARQYIGLYHQCQLR
jgi:starch synthase